MNTFIVNERPLTDDVLHVADEGHVFKGQLVALLEYHTYANEWGDHKHYKGFKTLEAAIKYLDKHYPDFQDEVWQS